MRRGVAAVAAVLAAGVALAVPGSTGTDAAPVRAAVAPMAPMAPCVHEDGPGPCVWDASARGNGRGHSLVVTAAGDYAYISHAAARRLLAGSK